MNRIGTKFWWMAAVIATTILGAGCGGAGSSDTGSGTGTNPGGGSAPTSTTQANLAKHLGVYSQALAAINLTTFAPGNHHPGGPYYSSPLGLWYSVSISSSTFTETFFQDQAETEPAGSATYTLDIATKTLSGTVSITQGPYAGLSGTYSQTVTKNGTAGNYNVNLPNGTIVSCQFTVSLNASGVPSGTATQSVTFPDGYSLSSTITYRSDHTFQIMASDSNGYSSVFNFAADLSGNGKISGPDPGLPAKLIWNSAGTGTVTFANGLTVPFTNWQLGH